MSAPALLTQDMAAIQRGLEDSPAILAAMVREIPEDRLHVQRREGFWSLAEHVAHLAQVQPMLVERVRRILSEDNPEFVPFPPGPGRERQDAARAVGGRFPGALPLRPGGHAEAAQAGPARGRTTPGAAPGIRALRPGILARHVLLHDLWYMHRMEDIWLTTEAYLGGTGN